VQTDHVVRVLGGELDEQEEHAERDADGDLLVADHPRVRQSMPPNPSVRLHRELQPQDPAIHTCEQDCCLDRVISSLARNHVLASLALSVRTS